MLTSVGQNELTRGEQTVSLLIDPRVLPDTSIWPRASPAALERDELTVMVGYCLNVHLSVGNVSGCTAIWGTLINNYSPIVFFFLKYTSYLRPVA
jgi:hypothetical protein